MTFTVVFECDKNDKRFVRRMHACADSEVPLDGAFVKAVVPGDAVTVPGKIVVDLADIDTSNVDVQQLTKLVAAANAYLERDE